MIEFLTKKGFSVSLTGGMVILSRKKAPDLMWAYYSLRSAYDDQGGPAGHIQYTGGRA